METAEWIGLSIFLLVFVTGVNVIWIISNGMRGRSLDRRESLYEKRLSDYRKVKRILVFREGFSQAQEIRNAKFYKNSPGAYVFYGDDRRVVAELRAKDVVKIEVIREGE